MSQVIAGRHAVYHAIRAGRRRVERIWLARGVDPGPLGELLRLAAEHSIPIERPPQSFFAKEVPIETHQGVAARVAALPLLSLGELLTALAAVPAPRSLLLLDQIQDPQNLGALLRSALCFGMEGVMVTRHRSAPLSPVAIKAAAGAVEYLRICEVAGLAQPIERLKEARFWIYGADPTEGEGVWQQRFSENSALVIGGEGRGLRRLVRERCDHLIRIPITGSLGSLNASVAGGVLMAELSRQKTLDLRPQSP